MFCRKIRLTQFNSDRDTAKTHREDTQEISRRHKMATSLDVLNAEPYGHSQSKYPARDAKCRGCGIKGHRVRFCLSKKVHEVDGRDGESDDESDAHLGTIDSESAVLILISSYSDGPWIIYLKVGQGFIRFKIDCGADVTVISEDMYLKIGKLPLEKSSKRLLGPGNVPLKVMGSFTAKLETNACSAVERIYVVKGLDRCLLGRPAITKLDLLEFKH